MARLEAAPFQSRPASTWGFTRRWSAALPRSCKRLCVHPAKSRSRPKAADKSVRSTQEQSQTQLQRHPLAYFGPNPV